MEPIISPWLIYAASICHKLSILSYVVATFSGVGGAIVWIVNAAEGSETNTKYIKTCGIVCSISLAIAILIPDKDTILSMLVAQYITPENVQIVQGDIVDFVKQIVEAVKVEQ